MMNQAKVFYRLLGLLMIPVLLASCSVMQAVQPVPTSTLVITPIVEKTETSRTGMPMYAKSGPYTVGMTYLPIQNGNYQVDAYVWYPVQMDGKPNGKDGPYPLVVYASGWATPAIEGYGYLLRHLASYGFVAVTWTPRAESSDTPSVNKWFAPLAYRPLDYKLIVDYLDSMTARGGPLEGMIDMKRIVIAGHSMGGGTALEESGAQIDFGWCAAHKDLIYKDNEYTCYQYVNYQEEIASNLGLETIPEGKWPAMNDTRIVATIPMAPVGKLWGAEYESVANIKVPALIMVGTLDTELRPELAAYPIYEHLGSQKKSMVVFEQKGHTLFWGPGYTSGTIEDLDRIKHITTAFVLVEAKGDQEAAKALAPANMNFSGVRYETTEFNSK